MLRNIDIRKWPVVLAAVVLGSAVLAGCSHDEGDGLPHAPAGNDGRGGDAEMYTISVGAASGLPETRAVYDGVTYKWSPADRVGFYMVPPGGVVPVVENARLVSKNTADAEYAHFEGGITATKMANIDPGVKYDYFSYFPYDAAADGGFPNVQLEIPAEMSLTPDVFPTQYGFMVATPVTTADGEKPLTWVEDGEQCYGKNVEFRYKHVFAYLEVYLALNLMSQPVNKIVVTCVDGSPISGTANIDVRTGSVSFMPGASNSLTVNVNGELDIWEDNGVKYNRVWIPINPALTGKQFKFDFYSAVDARNVSSETISGKPLEAGKKHKAGFKLPFVIDFQDLNGGERSGPFSHHGYDVWNNSVNTRNDYSLWWNRSGGRANGIVRLPADGLNLVNSYGATDIAVRITVDSKRNGNASDAQKRLKYAAISDTAQDFTGTNTPDLYRCGLLQITSNSNFGTTSWNMTFTKELPCFGLKSFFDGGSAYYHFVRTIRIEPL